MQTSASELCAAPLMALISINCGSALRCKSQMARQTMPWRLHNTERSTGQHSNKGHIVSYKYRAVKRDCVSFRQSFPLPEASKGNAKAIENKIIKRSLWQSWGKITVSNYFPHSKTGTRREGLHRLYLPDLLFNTVLVEGIIASRAYHSHPAKYTYAASSVHTKSRTEEEPSYLFWWAVLYAPQLQSTRSTVQIPVCTNIIFALYQQSSFSLLHTAYFSFLSLWVTERCRLLQCQVLEKFRTAEEKLKQWTALGISYTSLIFLHCWAPKDPSCWHPDRVFYFFS